MSRWVSALCAHAGNLREVGRDTLALGHDTTAGTSTPNAAGSEEDGASAVRGQGSVISTVVQRPPPFPCRCVAGATSRRSHEIWIA